MKNEPLLSAKGISKSFYAIPSIQFGHPAAETNQACKDAHRGSEDRTLRRLKVLEDVELTVFPSEIVALVGPSGAGKTTLLRIVAGKETADATSDNRTSIDVPPPTEVAWMPQETILVSALSAIHNVALGAMVRGESRRDALIQAESLLGELQLSNILRSYPAQLSLGMRQRVALARTLAAKPRLALLDEPISSLDLRLRQDVSRTLRNYVEEHSAGVVLVTHTIEEAVDYADRICVLNGAPGRISMIALRAGRRAPPSLKDTDIRICRSRAELFEVVSAELGIRDNEVEP